MRSIFSLCALALVVACAHTQRATDELSPAGGSISDTPYAPRVRSKDIEVQSYSELTPVSAVAELSGTIYVASGAKLWRFDPVRQPMAHPMGQEGEPIVALAAHPAQGLWAGTRNGLVARLEADGWVVVAAPHVGTLRALAASAEGVWVAGVAGAARWDGGAWRQLPIDAGVTVMRPQPGGRLWLAAATGLKLFDGKEVHSYGETQGQPLHRVDHITTTQAGAVLVSGRDRRGDGVLGYFDGRYWTSYRAPMPISFDWVARLRHELFVSIGGRVYVLLQLLESKVLSPPDEAIVLTSELAPDAPGGYPSPRFVLDPLPLRLPSATVVSDAGHEVLIGTRVLGVARIAPKHVRWLRPRTLTQGQQRLKMGCLAEACYLALHGEAVMHADGAGFSLPVLAGLPSNSYVHAFVTTPGGKIWLLHGDGGSNEIVISELVKEGVRRLNAVSIAGAPMAPRVRFTRVSPQGDIWVGLGLTDDDGQVRPWGVAVLRNGELIAHHRSTLGTSERRLGSDLVLPDSVRDVAFGPAGVVWIATSEGVVRIEGQKVTMYTENDGLESEICYAVDAISGGEVLVGTLRGVGRFDGTTWRFDLGRQFRKSTRVLLGDRSRLWAGTSSGLVRLDHGSVDVLSRADGLVTDGVLDLFRAPAGGLWVLTEDGISIVRE